MAWGFGSNKVTAKKAAQWVEAYHPQFPQVAKLRDALTAVAGERGSIDPLKLGHWLKQNKGRLWTG